MNAHYLLKDPSEITSLGQRLGMIPSVRKYDDNDYSESQTLARTFAELEESFRAYLEIQLPRLIDSDLSLSDLQDTLLDVGEEFRHILYHISDPLFYRYISSS